MRGLGLDAVGGVVLAVAELAYLPNLVVWALAWLTGAGFAVGEGTHFAPDGVVGGALPAVPMLGALPSSDVVGPATSLVPLVLVAVGAFVGLYVHRRLTPQRWWDSALACAAAAVGTVVVVTLLVTLASGGIGPDRLAEVGAQGGVVGLLAGAGVLVGALLVALPGDALLRAEIARALRALVRRDRVLTRSQDPVLLLLERRCCRSSRSCSNCASQAFLAPIVRARSRHSCLSCCAGHSASWTLRTQRPEQGDDAARRRAAARARATGRAARPRSARTPTTIAASANGRAAACQGSGSVATSTDASTSTREQPGEARGARGALGVRAAAALRGDRGLRRRAGRRPDRGVLDAARRPGWPDGPPGARTGCSPVHSRPRTVGRRTGRPDAALLRR